MNQRLEIGTHVHIWRRLLRLRVGDNAQRVLFTRLDLIIDIGDKAQALPFTLATDFQPNRNERRVFDLDTDLLYRRHQEIVLTVATNHRGKQTHHCRPPNRRTLIVPGPVARDTHVQVATERRVPQMHRRQPFLLPTSGKLRQQISSLACIGHSVLRG